MSPIHSKEVKKLLEPLNLKTALNNVSVVTIEQATNIIQDYLTQNQAISSIQSAYDTLEPICDEIGVSSIELFSVCSTNIGDQLYTKPQFDRLSSQYQFKLGYKLMLVSFTAIEPLKNANVNHNIKVLLTEHCYYNSELNKLSIKIASDLDAEGMYDNFEKLFELLKEKQAINNEINLVIGSFE